MRSLRGLATRAAEPALILGDRNLLLFVFELRFIGFSFVVGASAPPRPRAPGRQSHGPERGIEEMVETERRSLSAFAPQDAGGVQERVRIPRQRFDRFVCHV
jgi:hypothetical protein